ncbi:MAG: helix-turn-helix transcriptional regulator [Lachnospiraceae bacterium]|nr:helix-turn-helix transcriptional regulator [Lachnospiraceae bacterium]
MIEGKNSDRVIQVNDVFIGSNILDLRLKAGLKQVELVRMLQIDGLDISVFSYNRIEKGTQNPTVSVLLRLCTILNCDMNDIFGIDHKPF